MAALAFDANKAKSGTKAYTTPAPTFTQVLTAIIRIRTAITGSIVGSAIIRPGKKNAG